jgi:hypothetical protein
MNKLSLKKVLSAGAKLSNQMIKGGNDENCGSQNDSAKADQ